MSNEERPGRPEADERRDRAGLADRGDRWRDRVEVSLDGRQIFFLFFGSAVIATLLFVSGVLVGRRIEQRAAVPVAGDDPLAALDQLDNADTDDGLTFPTELVQHGKRSAREGSPRPAPRSSPRLDDAHAPAPASPASAALPSLPAPSLPVVALPRGPRVAPLPDPISPPPSPALAKPSTGRFTLQLSSFADRADAEAFAARVSAGGIPARVVESKIEGKGTFFRVRAGDYASRQAANDAKAAYDSTHSDPAMVAPE